jgi:predicted permease
METLLEDLRYGARTLLRTPGFTAIAILTLALGIGANSALFSVVNGVLLNPLPYPAPEQLASVYSKKVEFEHGSITYPNFLDWQKDNRSFSELACYRNDNLFLTGTGEGERLRGYQISANLFKVMGVKPILGREFLPEEDVPGAAPVVIISEGLWHRKFGSSREILGKPITLNNTSYTVVGVIPASFSLYNRVRDAYIPIGQWNDPTFRDRKISMGTESIGRLKPGGTVKQAQADMDNVARNLAAAYPDANKGAGIAVVSFKDDLVGNVRPILLVLLGAVGFVLLIACANVANLLLARATGRTHEFTIRAALGATRMRVVRQLLTESVLLSIASGGVGLAMAFWGTKAILRMLPDALPRVKEIGVDAHVLLFTLGVALAVGIAFGLAPALKLARSNLGETLKEGGRGASGTRHRTQSVFVALEMALALVLLVGAGLMIRSLAALWSVNPGFNPHNVLTFGVTMPHGLANNAAGLRAALRQMHSTLASVPGMQFASLQGGSLPMEGDSEFPFWLDGHPKPATQNEMESSLFYLVEPEYLKAMGTRLVRGRFLTEQDNETAPTVIVIDEYFAHKYFPNEDPIGKHVNLALVDLRPEIVGVAGHVKHFGLDSEGKEPIQAQLYMPFMQLPDQFWPLVANNVWMVARTQGPAGSATGTIRTTLARANSEEVMFGEQTMDEIVDGSLADRRFAMVLLGAFAALALALSSIGIYGVVSYLVGERTHEIGIRVALGAHQADVLKLVLGHGAKMALAGVAAGLTAALGLTRLMTKLLYGVGASDPVTFGGVAIVLTLVAMTACYVPARRAMRVDPIVALRYE